MNNPKEFYNQQIDQHLKLLNKVKKQLAVSSMIRMAVFALLVAGIYFGYPNTKIIIK